MGVLRLLYYIVIVLAGLYFAEANRGPVHVSLNPFPGGEGSNLGFEAPLFLVVFTAVALGVVLGALSSWMSHVGVRRSAKQARAEAARAQMELARLRSQALDALPSAPTKK
jgi:uncharacterized integral membrane protein